MHLETRVESLPEPMPVIVMLEELSSSGISGFEFVGYIPGSEYDFTSIVGSETLSLDQIQRIGIENIGRRIIEGKYVDVSDGAHILEHLAVGITSRVPGGYLPQIDFRCGNDNAELVYDFLTELGLDGYILFSGHSYHFQGITPMDKSAWQGFMERLEDDWLKEDYGIVDADWQSECVEHGYSVLRVTDAQDKPHVPEVVAKVARKLKYEGQMELPFD